MNKKQVYLTFIIFFLGVLNSFPQSYPPFYFTDTTTDSTQNNKIFLQIDNSTFFKNNEYFGDIAKGYTLLGFHLTPRLIYQPHERTTIRLGTQLLNYYGREDELKVSLLFSFQYQLHKNLNLTLGSIRGTLNHRLIEPLFDYERFFTHPPESGIQFLWDSKNLWGDLWLDWEQQIFYDEPFQEKFNVGLSLNYKLFTQNDFCLSIPFQNIIRHQGGQINSNNDPLVTIFNNATGIRGETNLSGKFIHQTRLSSYIVTYQDLSPSKQQMFIDGTASYSTLEFSGMHFNILLGYWYGKQFIAPLGNPLYETYSRTNIFVEEPIRQLLTAKINYHQQIFKGIWLDVRFEPFMDLMNGSLEYSYGMVIIFSERFFLKKIDRN
ncbi:MAG: hypothetical protein V2I54_02610 [Bacteroidales bacterium]|jgi:hypothetical protein|nr:hypothetical protein [Bacteroidales bacterium]